MSDPKITTWYSNGVYHEVVTRKGELSDTEFCRVHDQAVNFWKGVFPED